MIESENNQRIKKYSKLKDKKYRDEYNLFIVEGQYLIKEALKHNYIHEIFLLDDEENTYGEVTFVSKEVLKKLSSLKNVPKEIAVCKMITKKEIKGNVLIVDDIKDPGNLGTIIRSCAAFNYETIIISPESVSIYNPKVIRATEGMLFHINIIIEEIIPLIKQIKDNKYTIYGTDVIKGELPEKTNPAKHALIIGSEAFGIKEDILKLCDKNLYIKMNEKCESLNAAISASIIMYELNK